MKTHIKLSLLLLVLLLPAIATAHDIEVDGIYYNINGNEAAVTYNGKSSWSANSYSGDVTIPSSVTYNSTTYSITSIGEGAFYDCNGLTSITIPNSVTSIGDNAFDYCSGLTSITIPNSVTSIGSSAFKGCSGLTSIAIPNSVTSIGEEAFYDCRGLTYVTIPNTVTSIGYWAFALPPAKKALIGTCLTVFLTGEGEWIAGGLECMSLAIDGFRMIILCIDNGITGVKEMKVSPTEVYSFAVTPPTCDENSFIDTDFSGTLHVPAASLAAYFTAPYWCNFANIVGDAVKPNGVRLDKDSLDLVIQEMTTLETTISPANTSSGIIAWASSNPAVANVVNGQVTAVGHGECDIVATFLDKRAVCHVTVYSDRISVDEQVQLLPNHMVTLTPTSLASNLPALVVTSSDPTVAAARVMNGKVQVVGVSEGTATITVSATDGAAKPASCLVTVYTEQGDTNGDGYIDIDDVTALIERVLGNEAATIKEKNADLNDDGIMDIDDVTALINTILGNN